MRKLIAVLFAVVAMSGCAYSPSTKVVESNPPWCKDYIVTDPETGKRFLRYNSPQGNFVYCIDSPSVVIESKVVEK